MLYHVSRQHGLKVLRPHISTHGKPYVYAIDNMVTAMLFGAKKDDFDLLMDVREDGIPEVYECYPGAFRKIYGNKSCSVYEVSGEGFMRGVTAWEPELVCESEVSVLKETVLDDLYGQLMQEAGEGQLKIYHYEAEDSYRKKIAAHVVDRIFRFELDPETCMQKDERFATHYRELMRALCSILDGHLLK